MQMYIKYWILKTIIFSQFSAPIISILFAKFLAETKEMKSNRSQRIISYAYVDVNIVNDHLKW